MDCNELSSFLKDQKEHRIVNIIESRDENKIYVTDFKNGLGRFISMYINDLKISAKMQVTLTYIHKNEKIVGLEIIKIKNGIKDGKIKLTLDGLSKLIQVLDFLKSIDYPTIQKCAVSLNDTNICIDESVKGKIRTIFMDSSNHKFLIEILSNSDISLILRDLFVDELNIKSLVKVLKSGTVKTQDIVNIGYRKNQLLLFEEMLSNCEDEKGWQDFFEKNEWIFGYGLDYKFNHILQREYSTGSQGLDSKGDSKGDFILSDNKFTVLVELKTPYTDLFGAHKYRNGCWKISNDLADATSQILAQKHEVQFNFDNLTKDFEDDITLYDPKAILVIGNTKQFDAESPKEKRLKKRTFELYRRNLRNVEILTYDELFNRAKYILEYCEKELCD